MVRIKFQARFKLRIKSQVGLGLGSNSMCQIPGRVRVRIKYQVGLGLGFKSQVGLGSNSR